MARKPPSTPVPTSVDADLFARATQSHLCVRVVRLLRVLAAIVQPKMHYAIGGGVALAPAGCYRNTMDVNVFARPVASRRIIAALRAAGLMVEGLPNAHLIAYFPEDNRERLERGEPPEVRIDVLVTVTEPEVSAIRTAQPKTMAGLELRFMCPDELTALKFMAGRPRDLCDVDALVEAGQVDVAHAKHIIVVSEGDKKALSFARHVSRRRPPDRSGGRYMSRSALQAWFAGQSPPK